MDATSLRLTATLREKNPQLYPEQDPVFDVALENTGTAPVEAFDLSGNQDTPRYRVYDGAGNLQRELGIRDLERRMNAQMGEPVESAPNLVTIQPGKQRSTWVNLWSYTAPLPKGSYQFAVVHQLSPAKPDRIESGRVPFEIVDATVHDFAAGYESQEHSTSLLAWVADGPAGGRLLMRLSAVELHQGAQFAGVSLGPVPVASRVAIAEKPLEGTVNPRQWLALVRPGAGAHATVELIYTYEAHQNWRSAPIELAASDVRPIPAFPDRDHAVFLATARQGDTPVLTGVVVDQQHTGAPWRIALPVQPAKAACVFGRNGLISVLLVAADKQATRLFVMDIEETGRVAAAAREVWSGPEEVLAVAAHTRQGTRPSFFVLASDRTSPERMKLIRVTTAGEAAVRGLGELAGWPQVVDRAGVAHPARIRRAEMAVTPDAAFCVAMVDEEGRYFATALDGSPPRRLDSPNGPRVVLPHVVVLGGRAFYSGFTDRGSLLHLGGR